MSEPTFPHDLVERCASYIRGGSTFDHDDRLVMVSNILRESGYEDLIEALKEAMTQLREMCVEVDSEQYFDLSPLAQKAKAALRKAGAL